jgi:hypothetical protein
VSRAVPAADGAGVLGAVFAVLCCAGTPLIVSALAGVGLSGLRNAFTFDARWFAGGGRQAVPD